MYSAGALESERRVGDAVCDQRPQESSMWLFLREEIRHQLAICYLLHTRQPVHNSEKSCITPYEPGELSGLWWINRVSKPMAQRPHGLLDSYKCGPMHIFNLLKTLCVLLLLHLKNSIA